MDRSCKRCKLSFTTQSDDEYCIVCKDAMCAKFNTAKTRDYEKDNRRKAFSSRRDGLQEFTESNDYESDSADGLDPGDGRGDPHDPHR